MAIDRKELAKEIRSMIDESIRSDKKEPYDGTKKFNIHRYVNGLIEEGQKDPKLMSYLLKYNDALNNGIQDYQVFEKFGQGLARYAKGNSNVKNVINEMNKTLATEGNSLNGFLLIDGIEDPYVKDTVLEAYNLYLEDKNADTRNNLVEALEPLFMVSDPIAMKMQLLITEDNSLSGNYIPTNYINESEDVVSKKLQEAREKRQADLIFDKVMRHFDEKLNEEEEKKILKNEEYCLEGIANKNGIGLYEEIKKIQQSDAGTNNKLMEVLAQYKSALTQGAYEERLYETFIQNISKFNYLLPVDRAIKSINEKVAERSEEINLTKLLEMMKDDAQSFIYVDLIQEDVARYVKEPNPTNRIQLRNALMPYASDTYINTMFDILYSDNSRRANELTERAMNIKDQINIIKENATISNIYSPVQYVKENESVFNVNGQYYVKKGNNISLLSEKYVNQLNEKFTELCQLVNDPHVSISDDYITLQGNNKTATIYEGYVTINSVKESQQSLRNLRDMCIKYEDYDTNFFIMCSCLLENFNNIAKIDWAKHITLNENTNISVDVFKLDQHIFMSTHNDTLGKHTFYRNINPIYCRNKMNEHMGINVSSMFSDLLPNQNKIILKLNETKNAYEDAIQQYQAKLEQLKKAEATCSAENKQKLKDAINDCEQTLKEYEEEFKSWQENVEKELGTESDSKKKDDKPSKKKDKKGKSAKDDDEDDVNVEISNEPLDDDEVDDHKQELSVPLTSDDGEQSENNPVSNDEFQEFLDDNENGDYTEEPEKTSDDQSFFDTVSDDTVDTDALFNSDEDDDIKDKETLKEVDIINPSDDAEVKQDDDSDIFEPTEEPGDGDLFNDGEDEGEDGDLFKDSESDEDDEEPGDDATGVFGGNVEDPLNTDDEDDDTTNLPFNTYAYNVAGVNFNQNIKTGVIMKSGTVIVLVPMVDGTGKTYIDTKNIKFYLDEDNNPVLNNDSITADLYSVIINAIKSDENYSIVCETGEDASGFVPDFEDDDSIYMNNSYYTDQEREELGDIPVIPTYKSGDTEIELPAANIDYTLVPDADEDDIQSFLNGDDDNDTGFSHFDKNDFEEDGFRPSRRRIEIDDDDDDDSGFRRESSFDDDNDDDSGFRHEPSFDDDDDDSGFRREPSDEDDPFKEFDDDDDSEFRREPSIEDDEDSLFDFGDDDKPSLKESIRIRPVFKKAQPKRFFVNESTIKDSSKKQTKNVTPLKEKFDGSNRKNSMSFNLPIEQYDINNDINTFEKMYNRTKKIQEQAKAYDKDFNISKINEIQKNGQTVKYFTLDNLNESYTIYQINNSIYFRNSNEFYQLLEDVNDGIRNINSFKYKYNKMNESLMSYSIDRMDDCLNVVSSIVESIIGYSIFESNKPAKIKKRKNASIKKDNGLDTDYDVNKSVKHDEAQHGTPLSKSLEDEREQVQKEKGVTGVLDAPQQESIFVNPTYKMILEAKPEDIYYEPNDKVIVNGERAIVTNVIEKEDGTQKVTVLQHGKTIELEPSQIKPDPEQFKNLSDIEPYDQKDLDMKQPKKGEDKMHDLNSKTIECNIVIDGMKFNMCPYYAVLNDIIEGCNTIRVIGENNTVNKWLIENIEFDPHDWPVAVIQKDSADGTESETLRQIKVNPTSYVDAKDDDDLVQCLVGDNITEMPKRIIKILS